MSRVVKYWLHEIRNAKTAETTTPGAIDGKVMNLKTWMGDAPSVRACASRSTSKREKLPVSVNTQYGTVGIKCDKITPVHESVKL